MLPAPAASSLPGAHGGWWLLLALIVLVLVSPLAYTFSRHGGRPGA